MSTTGGGLAPQGLVDPVGDTAFQAPECVGFGPSLGELAVVVGAALGVAGDLGQGDVVQDPVELAVAATVDSLGRLGCQVGLVAWLTILLGVVRLARGRSPRVQLRAVTCLAP